MTVLKYIFEFENIFERTIMKYNFKYISN